MCELYISVKFISFNSFQYITHLAFLFCAVWTSFEVHWSAPNSPRICSSSSTVDSLICVSPHIRNTRWPSPKYLASTWMPLHVTQKRRPRTASSTWKSSALSQRLFCPLITWRWNQSTRNSGNDDSNFIILLVSLDPWVKFWVFVHYRYKRIAVRALNSWLRSRIEAADVKTAC